jgi:predicted ATPase
MSERDAVFAMWLDGLDALAAGRPTIWLMEDVHWAPADLLAFLAAATVRPSAAGRMVLATARTSLFELAPAWVDTASTSHVSLLHLDPLSDRDVARLLESLVGPIFPPKLRAEIVAASDGNALFVEELIRMWVSVGIIQRSQGNGWLLRYSTAPIRVPTTVHAVYAAQLDDLPTTARETSLRASVVGRQFPVAALPPLGVTDPSSGLATLERRVLVAPVPPDPDLGAAYAFRHILLRDAAYATLTRADRCRLHLLVASWLEQRGEGHPDFVAERVAQHLLAALEGASPLSEQVAPGVDREQLTREAAQWLERASDFVLASAAPEAARSLLERSVELTPEIERLNRSRRLVRLGEIDAYTASMERGEAEIQEGIAHARTAMADANGDRDASAEVARGVVALGRVWVDQLRFQEALSLADQTLR